MNKSEINALITNGRNFMKMPMDDESYSSDQELKKQQPPLTKAPMRDTNIELPTNYDVLNRTKDFLTVINTRESNRIYTKQSMSLLQLSYLLWCSQGVKDIRGKSYATLRTVPCGGARHEFECYMAIQNVEELESGLYHYLPLNHSLEFLKPIDDVSTFINQSVAGQTWVGKANVVFYYSMVAYRAEWRYGIYAHRVALMDVGYVSENLYLAAASIQLGSCAIGYIEEAMLNEAFECDGEEEFIILAHPVGTISKDNQEKENDIYAFVKQQGL